MRVVNRERPIAHALEVMRAVRLDNYHRFFHLYKQTPNMGNKLLDLMIDNARLQYLSRLCKSHKPAVSVTFVSSELGFSPTSFAPLKHAKNSKRMSLQKEIVNAQNSSVAIQFLRKAGCILLSSPAIETLVEGHNYDLSCIEESLDINTKDTVIDFASVLNQDKLL